MTSEQDAIGFFNSHSQGLIKNYLLLTWNLTTEIPLVFCKPV